MSVSSDAILFYGYCWSEECNLFEDSDTEWEEVIAIKRGFVNPWGTFPAIRERIKDYSQRKAAEDAWIVEHDAELNAWRDAKKAIAAEFDCNINYHCHGNCSMPYISVSNSRIRADRGCPEEVNSLEVQPDWDVKLERFLNELGIKEPHPSPRWWLVSYSDF